MHLDVKWVLFSFFRLITLMDTMRLTIYATSTCLIYFTCSLSYDTAGIYSFQTYMLKIFTFHNMLEISLWALRFFFCLCFILVCMLWVGIWWIDRWGDEKKTLVWAKSLLFILVNKYNIIGVFLSKYMNHRTYILWRPWWGAVIT